MRSWGDHTRKGGDQNPILYEVLIPTSKDRPKSRPTSSSPTSRGAFRGEGRRAGARSFRPPAAIVNAVNDAIGVRIMDLPITPEKVLAALEKKAQSGGSDK